MSEAKRLLKKFWEKNDKDFEAIKANLEDAVSQGVKITKKMIKDAVKEWGITDKTKAKELETQLMDIFL